MSRLSRRSLLTGGWFEEATPPSEPEPRTPVHWHRKTSRPPIDNGPKVARVLTFSCLNQLGGFCGTCVERCPVPGAIRMDGRTPTVATDVCDGCGICSDLCPAPGNAIVLGPRLI